MGTDGTYIDYLTAEDYPDAYRKLHTGEELDIMVNQAERPATVLAVIGAEALLEYVMPSGRSALRRVPVWYRKGTDPGWPYKRVSYRSIPKCWLVQIVRNGLEWWASPQQVPDLHMTPRQLFLSKWPEEEWKLYTPDGLNQGLKAQMDRQREAQGPSAMQMAQTARTNQSVRGRIMKGGRR